jgi:hypothetical protein
MTSKNQQKIVHHNVHSSDGAYNGLDHLMILRATTPVTLKSHHHRKC